MERAEGIGILDGLSDDQKDQLITWVETLPIETVLQKVAGAPPEGFNIRTHVTSLRRFYQRHRMIEQRDILPLARSAQIKPEELSLLESATSAALSQHFFEAAASPALNRTQVGSVARWLISMREQQIRRDQLAIARERLELERQKLRMAAVFKQVQTTVACDIERIEKAIHEVLDQ